MSIWFKKLIDAKSIKESKEAIKLLAVEVTNAINKAIQEDTPPENAIRDALTEEIQRVFKANKAGLLTRQDTMLDHVAEVKLLLELQNNRSEKLMLQTCYILMFELANQKSSSLDNTTYGDFVIHRDNTLHDKETSARQRVYSDQSLAFLKNVKDGLLAAQDLINIRIAHLRSLDLFLDAKTAQRVKLFSGIMHNESNELLSITGLLAYVSTIMNEIGSGKLIDSNYLQSLNEHLANLHNSLDDLHRIPEERALAVKIKDSLTVSSTVNARSGFLNNLTNISKLFCRQSAQVAQPAPPAIPTAANVI